jgi:hypothetical protein
MEAAKAAEDEAPTQQRNWKERRNQEQMPEEQHSEEKKSLFGTKNLKEGAI